MTEELTSQTAETPQEQPEGHVAEATTAPGSSQGAPPAQEPEPLTDEQIEKLLQDKRVQSVMSRRIQSAKDKEIAETRRRMQEMEEQKRLSQMDDEAFGRHLRQQQKAQQSAQPLLRETLTRAFTEAQEQAVAIIEDDTVREELEKRIAANEFQSLGEFLAGVGKAYGSTVSKKEVQREKARLEKEIRESVTKELTADQAEELAPQLGRGLPASRRISHGENAIAEGYAEKLKQARKGG